MGQYLQLKKQVKLSQLFNLEIAKLIFFCIRYYDLKEDKFIAFLFEFFLIFSLIDF